MIPSEEETARKDSEVLCKEQQDKTAWSAEASRDFLLRMQLCKSQEALDRVSKEITVELKKKLSPTDVNGLREAFLKESLRVKGLDANDTSKDEEEYENE